MSLRTVSMAATLCLALGVPAISGCSASFGRPSVGRPPGPPPHAPAYGRRAADGNTPTVELRFDPALGVHVVVGYPGIYFDDGVYLQIGGDGWLASAALDGPWNPVDAGKVPPGLRAKGMPPGQAKGRGGPGNGAGHSAHPAKGAW